MNKIKNKSKGIVYLIGAGPGDPDLITIRGRKCLSMADIIVYDYLVSESLLSLAHKDAKIIYVGKKSGHHTMPQKDINNLLTASAKRGLTVARLKGGDPFIFGRGGEEALELSKEGIPFEIIPGVTSAVAAPAYAGIPLTHRNFASNACFITGHEDPTKKESHINWNALAQSSGTLVFLMGIANLDRIVKKLIDLGRSPKTPAAVIGNGTMPNQKTVIGTLADIDQKVKDVKLGAPGVVVVGDVVNLNEYLNWFESRPLFGKTIVVTRPEDQAAGFIQTLSELGANCLSFPTITILPPATWRKLDKAIENLSIYDWIIFTSVNGVKYFFKRLHFQKKDTRYLNGITIGAIGPKTAAALIERGLHPDMVPDQYWAEGVVEGLKKSLLVGRRVLLPRPVLARDYIPKKLTEFGAIVDVIEAYQTVKPDYSQHQLSMLFKDSAIDMITFTSPSTVDNFLALVKGRSIFKELLKAKVACIGPITAQQAVKKGLKVDIVPDEYTAKALTGTIIEYYKKH